MNPEIISTELRQGESTPWLYFGRVDQSAFVLLTEESIDAAKAAIANFSLKPSEHPEDHHAGSNVYVVELPDGITQQEYADKLARASVLEENRMYMYEANRKRQKIEVNQSERDVLILNVTGITASEENLWLGLKTIAQYADENSRGYAFVLDQELNIRDEHGNYVYDANGETVIDKPANDRLSVLRKALASTALVTYNILPGGYHLDELTPEEEIEFYGEQTTEEEIEYTALEGRLIEVEVSPRTVVNTTIRKDKSAAPMKRRSNSTPAVKISSTEDSLF